MTHELTPVRLRVIRGGAARAISITGHLTLHRRPTVIPGEIPRIVPALGRAHHNRRPRGSWRAYVRAHFPATAAYIEGDWDRVIEFFAEESRRTKVARQSIAFCVFCRFPMVVAEGGYHYCPYKKLADHSAMREVNPLWRESVQRSRSASNASCAVA